MMNVKIKEMNQYDFKVVIRKFEHKKKFNKTLEMIRTRQFPQKFSKAAPKNVIKPTPIEMAWDPFLCDYVIIID